MFISRWKRICIVSALLSLSAFPVYADGSSSVPVGINGRSMGRTVNDVSIGISDELKKPDTVASPVPASLGSFVSAAGIAGKKVSSVDIVGGNLVPTAMFMDSLSLKPGKSLDEESILKDIRGIYASGFYQDVSFGYSVSEDGSVSVFYQVVENPSFKGVDTGGSQVVDPQGLSVALASSQGQVFNLKMAGELLSKVTADARKAGYALFSLKSMEFTPDGILHLKFIDGIVDGFEIQGNRITKPDVIVRELRQDLQRPLNTAQLQRSGQRLNMLGLFDGVDFQLVPSPSDPEHVKVLVVVDEANNATVGLGVGYSEADGTVGQFTVGDKNFLGKGDNVQLTWEFGGKTLRNYNFSYTRPYLDRKGTSITLNLYDGIRESAEYDHGGQEMARFDKRALGQEITLSRPDGEYVRNSVRIKNRKDEYKGPVDGYNRQYFEPAYDAEFLARYGYATTAAERRKEDFGVTRSLTFARVYDNRDNVYDPKHGKRNEVSFEWAGFGGDFNFRKLYVDQRYYWSAGPKKNPHTVALDLAAGYAWGDMPLSQRFAVGGASTLRGYEDAQFRGNSMLRGSLEYRVPVAKRVSLLAFVDAGYAWDKRLEKSFDLDKIKVGYGIGVRLLTPVGPVKLDYGFGKREAGQSYKGRFHFSFGGNF